MGNILLHNYHIALIGWLAWNVAVFSFTKDDADDANLAFDVKSYAKTHWDNWLASLFMIPVLLIIGTKQLGMDALAALEIKMKWSNLYYLGSGFITEAAKFSYKKWRKSKQV